MNDNHLIDPQTLPTWTVAGFILALLALSAALVGVYRTNHLAVVSQAEVMTLTQRINDLQKKVAAAPSAAAPAAVASTAPAAPEKK